MLGTSPKSTSAYFFANLDIHSFRYKDRYNYLHMLCKLDLIAADTTE